MQTLDSGSDLWRWTSRGRCGAACSFEACALLRCFAGTSVFLVTGWLGTLMCHSHLQSAAAEGGCIEGTSSV